MTWMFALKLIGLIVAGTGSITAAAGKLLSAKYQQRAQQAGLIVAVAGFMIAIASLIGEQRRDAAKSLDAAQQAIQRAEETKQLLSNQAETLKQISRALNPLDDMTIAFELTADATQPGLAAYETRLRQLIPSEQLKLPAFISGVKDRLPQGTTEQEARSLLLPSMVMIGILLPGSETTSERFFLDPDFSVMTDFPGDWATTGGMSTSPRLIYRPSERTFCILTDAHHARFGDSRSRFSSLEDFANAHMQVWIPNTGCTCQVKVTLQTKHGKLLTVTGHKDKARDFIDIQLSDHPWR